MARPNKLTPRVRKRFLYAVSKNVSMDNCARYAGVAPSTYYLWMAKAEKGVKRYQEFSEQVKDAIAQTEVDLAVMLHSAAPNAHGAAVALLERRFPETWGRKTKHEHSGTDGGSIGVLHLFLPKEDDD